MTDTNNLLKRGIDPYADADVTDERTGWVGPLSNVVSGTTEVFAPALHKGRVREIIGVVTVAITVADALVDLEADGNVIAQVDVVSGLAIGAIVRAAIVDDSGAPDDNLVNQLSNLSVVSDGGATAGAVDWYIHVSADL